MPLDDEATEKGATISECGQYRYNLWRKWGPGPICTYIMLNPSTADASVDDRTIGRCISFAKAAGCDAINVVNLFAFRTKDPKIMARADDPVGPNNDTEIRDAYRMAHKHGWPIVAAWGAEKIAHERGRQVREMLAGLSDDPVLQCLAISKEGHPRHPLYLSGKLVFVPFE
jgi:hypothetical protein